MDPPAPRPARDGPRAGAKLVSACGDLQAAMDGHLDVHELARWRSHVAACARCAAAVAAWETVEQGLAGWAASRTARQTHPGARSQLLRAAAVRSQRPGRRFRRVWLVSSAAAAILAVGLAWKTGFHPSSPSPSLVIPELADGLRFEALFVEGPTTWTHQGVRVAGAGRAVARLGPDLIGIGARSSLLARIDADEQVTLVLEAGTVAVDAAHREGGRPLRVEAGEAYFTIVGTRLLLERTLDGATELSVEEGAVRATHGGVDQLVTAGSFWHMDGHGPRSGSVPSGDTRLAQLLSTQQWRPAAAEVPDAPQPTRALVPDPVVSLPPQGPLPGVVQSTFRARIEAGDLSVRADLVSWLAQHPEDDWAWALLALQSRAEGDAALELQAWQSLTDRGSGFYKLRGRYESARILSEEASTRAEARDLLLSLVEEGAGPLDADARLRLGRLQAELGDRVGAKATLNDLMARHPGTAPARAAVEALRRLRD